MNCTDQGDLTSSLPNLASAFAAYFKKIFHLEDHLLSRAAHDKLALVWGGIGEPVNRLQADIVPAPSIDAFKDSFDRATLAM